MIDRSNWKLTRAYLAFRIEVDQIGKGSARLEEDWLRHLLEWAKDKPFARAPHIRPAFPTYLLNARLDGKAKPLSRLYVLKVIGTARRFFSWLTRHRLGFSKIITPAWLDTLKPPTMTIEPIEHEAVTLEEVRAMAQAPALTTGERRIRAAAVFLFLSGIRIDAFVSLPLAAIDINVGSVKQWPGLGVRTKFKKRATTFLLPLPELLEVVATWDREVRALLPAEGLWFAPLSPETGEIDTTLRAIGEQRSHKARKDLKNWLERVGLPYHSPHKFRHGHAVYALKHSKDIGQFKAVSQNLMHSNLSITDGIYGMLSDLDVQQRIAALGSGGEGGDTKETIIMTLRKLLSELQR